MNKIDAFGVIFSTWLVWMFAVYLVPLNIMIFVYMGISAWAVGVFIGRLPRRLAKETDKDFLDAMFEVNNEQSQVMAEMLRSLQIAYAANQASLAKIDQLMFEYCPEEMTEAQIANYEAHVRAVSQQQEDEVNRALH